MEKKNQIWETSLLALTVFLATALLLLTSGTYQVIAGVGSPNATVTTILSVGNVFPEVLNVSLDDDAASVTLVANSTQLVSCLGVVRDYNGEGDISNVNATFYDSAVSSSEDTDDNNYHYTNTSCFLNNSFGSYNGYNDDAYTSLANCSFSVQYYANPSSWICNVTVNDSTGWHDTGFDDINISQLLALGLPDVIDYGLVNATEISHENQTNVSNYGNTVANLSLEGYSVTPGDGNAMNCSLGALENISIEHEKYNLTTSNTSSMTLEQAHPFYTNLTTTPTIRFFNLTARTNDTADDTIKSTYWRIYVPVGVAGNCTGNIVFGATTADGS